MNKKKRNKTNGLIPQRLSVNSFVKPGTDWDGKKLSKSWIKSSMELETWVDDNQEYFLTNGWSDYPPNYTIGKKRKNKLNGGSKKIRNGKNEIVYKDISNDYFKVIEIFCRDDYYLICDRRMNSPYQEGWYYKEPFSFDELIKVIECDEYGIDSFEFMKVKGLKSLGPTEEGRSGEKVDGSKFNYTNEEILDMMKEVTL